MTPFDGDAFFTSATIESCGSLWSALKNGRFGEERF
jgi:hypothetical protein